MGAKEALSPQPEPSSESSAYEPTFTSGGNKNGKNDKNDKSKSRSRNMALTILLCFAVFTALNQINIQRQLEERSLQYSLEGEESPFVYENDTDENSSIASASANASGEGSIRGSISSSVTPTTTTTTSNNIVADKYGGAMNSKGVIVQDLGLYVTSHGRQGTVKPQPKIKTEQTEEEPKKEQEDASNGHSSIENTTNNDANVNANANVNAKTLTRTELIRIENNDVSYSFHFS